MDIIYQNNIFLTDSFEPENVVGQNNFLQA